VGGEGNTKVRSPYWCNHCEEEIPLDGDNTFYKCFCHSCTDYWLCENCAHEPIVDNNPDGHQWWHTLLVLCTRIVLDLDDGLPDDQPEAQTTQRSVDAGTGADAIGNRISAVVVAKLDATHSMLQTKLDSILEGHARSTADQAGDNDAQGPIGELENRMSQLEDKVDTILTELRGDGGKDGAGEGLEDRMSQLEEKMDMMLGEMRKFFSSSAQAPSASTRGNPSGSSRSQPPFESDEQHFNSSARGGPAGSEGGDDLDSFAPEARGGYPGYNDNGDDDDRYNNDQDDEDRGDGGDDADGDDYNRGDGGDDDY